VLVGGIVAAVALTCVGQLDRRVPWARWGRWAGAGVAGLGLAAALGGPVAYTLETVDTPHTGSIVTAGPAVASGGFGPGGGGGFPGRGGGGTGGRGGFPGGANGTTGGGTNARGGPGGMRGGFPGGNGKAPTGKMPTGKMPTGKAPTGQGGGGFPGGGSARGGMGGLLNGSSVSGAMKKLLAADASHYTWVAATIGSQNAASYQLATQDPVMAIGGFNGTDPSPTLAQFRKWVSEGRVHYYLASGGFGAGGGGANGTGSSITSWVEKHFTKKTVGGSTVYDLTKKKS
jgi:hypothetical protein